MKNRSDLESAAIAIFEHLKENKQPEVVGAGVKHLGKKGWVICVMVVSATRKEKAHLRSEIKKLTEQPFFIKVTGEFHSTMAS